MGTFIEKKNYSCWRGDSRMSAQGRKEGGSGFSEHELLHPISLGTTGRGEMFRE